MKRIVVAGALLGSGLLLAGCGIGDIGGPEQEDTVSYDVADKVALLEIDSEAGDIVVTEADRSGIKVTETLHWRGQKPEPEHPVNGDRLALSYNCPGGMGFRSCSVDYRVEVPRGLGLTVSTGSGDITLRNASGTLIANTGSGDIEAAGLTSKESTVETGSGAVELRYTAVPAQVKVETGSGDATVRVPDGRYDVEAETGSGDRSVEVSHDPSASAKVIVTTGSGNAAVLKS
ncbi:DUF4097 family beta strand repeat-containing protein [Spongiactinospora sp. TRM90649]|uniref:DUF4097 family beta strand repeat-containing protein n=1 Tax=Spongiactinospora sp. TRM90649 TaxID=3031114 RepID=UPI0023F9E4F3|nr:DUF4097 family beta strand repeat-containing protein [Spongiactinospora sp. TRM90649]MDF5754086.1 DUF4097 family beta strand repeat-containing protein [Spongiactinospora sp. TRM90649]